MTITSIFYASFLQLNALQEAGEKKFNDDFITSCRELEQLIHDRMLYTREQLDQNAWRATALLTLIYLRHTDTPYLLAQNLRTRAWKGPPTGRSFARIETILPGLIYWLKETYQATPLEGDIVECTLSQYSFKVYSK